MAVTTDPFNATDLAARIPEIWTPLVLREMRAKAVATNFFTDLSEYAADGGDIFHVADIYTNTFTVQSQSTQGAEVTTAAVAQNDVTLTVNNHKYIAYVLGDKDMKQLVKSFNFSAEYARKASNALIDDIETALFALWSGLTANSAVGDTGTVLTDVELRSAIATIAGNKHFPRREMALFVHPDVYWKQLMGVQKYYDVSQAGWSVRKPVITGNFGEFDEDRGLVGSLYGIPVFETTNVASGLQTYRNILAHKSAFGFAFQTPGNGMIRVQAENAIRNLGILTVADMIYGVAELRDEAAVVVNANISATA